MKIACWNVNSIHARLPILLEWLQESRPDVVLLQETKTQDEKFPREPLEDLGYNIEAHGEKSYNGVAILSKYPIEDVQFGLPGNGDDQSCRYVEAFVNGTRVASVYVPNGQDLDSPKYPYKLQFLDYLAQRVETVLTYQEPYVLAGDFNVAPTAQDVYDPKVWKENRILCSIPERAQLRRILHKGMIDIHRAHHPHDNELYSWWDYRTNGWLHNRGLRIDLMLLSPQASDRIVQVGIDKEVRGKPRPSDHTPVWCELAV